MQVESRIIIAYSWAFLEYCLSFMIPLGKNRIIAIDFKKKIKNGSQFF